MKRDPGVQQLLRGELLASSPLGYERARSEMLEALLDLLPSYTRRDHADPGIALVEALAAVLDIFGFYHDRFLTESKIGSAQSLQSVKLLGDTVGYTPRPALAAKTLQFFEARTVGVILAGSKLAGRTPDVPGKVIFETLRSLVIGPAFNRMALDPNVTRQVGALRAVIRRFAAESPELVTPLDEFAAGSLAMINGSRGLELVPVAGARTRALAVARPLRRSYGLDDTRIHRATEYRHLLHPLPLAEKADDSAELVVFEVCDCPILHVPSPSGAQRLQSTLELYVFPPGIDPHDPAKWTADRRWQEVPDFTASEAADRHYRTFVDDRLRTYAILRRKMGYRDLLSPEELANVYVRFTPAIGRITDADTVAPKGHLVELNDEYFTSPLVLPKVDGQFVKTEGSLWVVTDRSLDLLPGRQIIIENSATQEKFIRTLGPRTTGQYLSWDAPEASFPLPLPIDDNPLPEPLWERIAADIMNRLLDGDWRKGLFLQTFGHYFPLDFTVDELPYRVRPGRGVAHDIADDLLFIEDIPQRHDRVPGWEDGDALSISQLREAVKAGPYHLWDQFYREFENLDWRLRTNDPDNIGDMLEQGVAEDKKSSPNLERWQKARLDTESASIGSVTIVPRGSTFIIVQDTSLVRPGDYFMIGKRVRRFYSAEDGEDALDCTGVGRKFGPGGGHSPRGEYRDIDPALDVTAGGKPESIFRPGWIKAEVLQAVEVQGKIVRLKWPVTYDYVVDFLCVGDNIQQPITELIIVPQVASVFFGDYFTQRLQLKPNVKTPDQGASGPSDFVEILDTFNPAPLQEAAGWSEKTFNEIWADLFFGTLNVADGVEMPEMVAPDGSENALVWKVFVGLELTAATLMKVGGIYVGALDMTNIFSQKDLVEVNTTAAYSVDGQGYVTHLCAVDAANLAKMGIHEMLGPEELEYWAELTSPVELTIVETSFDNVPSNEFKVLGDGTYGGLIYFDRTIVSLNGGDAQALVIAMKLDPNEPGEPDADWKFRAVMIGNESRPAVIKKVHVTAVKATPREDGLRAVRALTVVDNAEFPIFIAEAHATPEPDPKYAKYPDSAHANSIELISASDDFAGFKTNVAWILGGGNSPGKYYAFKDKRDVLHKSWYSVNKTNDDNFLYANGEVDRFKIDADASLAGTFILFSREKGVGEDAELAVFGRLGERIPTYSTVMVDSVIFNSGNFIPVRLGNSDADELIIRNSIRVTLGDASTADSGDVLDYSYDLSDFTDLEVKGEKRLKFGFGKTPEGTFTLHFRIDREVEEEHVPEVSIQVYYSAEPYQEDIDAGEAKRTHHAAYPICEGQTQVCWKEARFYQFETRPLPWNPLRQLVIMNSGELQAGDYIFIDPAGVSKVSETPCKAAEGAAEVVESEEERSRDHIQWTRVVEVDGRMVIVDPPVKIQPRGFYHYRVTGYRRPAGAASPDEDYYKLLQSEDKPEATTPPELDGLSFGNRLMLKPFVTPSEQTELVAGGGDKGTEDKDRSQPKPAGKGDDTTKQKLEHEMLLEHLVPGDRLLVWDRRWRDAWRARREKGLAKVAGRAWVDWPERQHEVVIKRIVPKLGLVELEEPLPARFGVAYPIKDGKLDMVLTSASVKAFRALPFYREPFQGKRELIVLGDGDRRSKFARFTAGAKRDFGLASIALQQAGTLASNIEVLTVERASGRWERWTEFSAIDTARRQDQAFVLGVEWPERQDDPCADFRLELQEKEDEEKCWCEEGVALPALPIPLPLVDLQLLPIPLPLVDLPGLPIPLPLGGLPTLPIPLPLVPSVEPTELSLVYPATVSVSFGDGVHGQTPPNGRGNVFIRPVEIEPWCRHLPTRTRQRVRDVRRDCLPLRVSGSLASERNLVIEVEHSVHEAWQPRGEKHQWRAPLIVEVDLTGLTIPEKVKTVKEGDPARTLMRLRGISDAEAVAGYDGVVVRPLRPGASVLSVVLPGDIYETLEHLSQAAILARVEVFEVPGSEIWVLDAHFYQKSMKGDPTVSPGAETVLLSETEGLDEDSSLAFSQRGEPGEPVEVVGVKTVDHATYSATLESPLQRTYRLDRSYLFGNLVEAVQGDSERLVIGSGDGATRGLRLPLNNRQTILFSSDDEGVLTPGVVLLVDDVQWERVGEFAGRGPRDRIYRLEFEADGEAYVRFGDGVQGAIPAAGFDNIVVVLRTGDGARGNLDVGAIDKLLDGNLAVERTRNVTPAAGGKAADDPAAARRHLMERSFTQGRVVTRDDLVRAVRALANVSQARLDPTAPPEVLRAVVALTRRRPATASDLLEIRQRVCAVTPLAAGIEVELVDAEQLPVHLVLEITVQAGFAQGEALQALERAFSADDDGFFDLERWPIGAPLRAGDVYEQAFSLPAVATARIRWMSREVPPTDLPTKVPDVLRPGPTQVIRCDNDRAGDPNGIRGTLRVRIKGGVA
ncbi:hypothetical protein [Nannocystis punicea]|uniref:Baseplate J-like protein n=1 Tax=Nannocystis punicea TaxID=2995304 RepID=A0ABY7H6C0_9BACT|nr:hypothetical protein [Nannocystis poenicansa]WAS94836.1 hypothetical protein O0S08_01635 [Nannocystis poenicansa]